MIIKSKRGDQETIVGVITVVVCIISLIFLHTPQTVGENGTLVNYATGSLTRVDSSLIREAMIEKGCIKEENKFHYTSIK